MQEPFPHRRSLKPTRFEVLQAVRRQVREERKREFEEVEQERESQQEDKRMIREGDNVKVVSGMSNWIGKCGIVSHITDYSLIVKTPNGDLIYPKPDQVNKL